MNTNALIIIIIVLLITCWACGEAKKEGFNASACDNVPQGAYRKMCALNNIIGLGKEATTDGDHEAVVDAINVLADRDFLGSFVTTRSNTNLNANRVANKVTHYSYPGRRNRIIDSFVALRDKLLEDHFSLGITQQIFQASQWFYAHQNYNFFDGTVVSTTQPTNNVMDVNGIVGDGVRQFGIKWQFIVRVPDGQKGKFKLQGDGRGQYKLYFNGIQQSLTSIDGEEVNSSYNSDTAYESPFTPSINGSDYFLHVVLTFNITTGSLRPNRFLFKYGTVENTIDIINSSAYNDLGHDNVAPNLFRWS